MSLAETMPLELGEPERVPSRAFQQLWFTLEAHRWTSLVVVPADPRADVVRVARALAAVGGAVERGAVELLSGCGSALGELPRLLAAVSAAHGGGPRRLIPVDPLVDNPLGIALAHASDAVLLCIPLGAAELAPTSKAVELLGADRIIGCVTVAARSAR